jgi:hypothetical protein
MRTDKILIKEDYVSRLRDLAGISTVINEDVDKILIKEDMDAPVETVLNGMSNQKARTYVGNVARKAFHTGIYRDDSWQPVAAIYKALDNAGIDYDMTGSQYSPEFPNTYKKWELTFKFTNDKGRPSELHGQIMAAGAGSVEQPLDRYDMNFTIY